MQINKQIIFLILSFFIVSTNLYAVWDKDKEKIANYLLNNYGKITREFINTSHIHTEIDYLGLEDKYTKLTSEAVAKDMYGRPCHIKCVEIKSLNTQNSIETCGLSISERTTTGIKKITEQIIRKNIKSKAQSGSLEVLNKILNDGKKNTITSKEKKYTEKKEESDTAATVVGVFLMAIWIYNLYIIVKGTKSNTKKIIWFIIVLIGTFVGMILYALFAREKKVYKPILKTSTSAEKVETIEIFYVECVNCGFKHENPITDLCSKCARSMSKKDTYIKCKSCGSEYDDSLSSCSICGN